MATEIKTLKPELLWSIFYDITQIPRPSGKEEASRNYVLEFARKHGLQAEVDAVGNVLVRKPATPGMENRKTVVLQGHLDMVPQANSDSKHNFDTDPIDAYIDGEWVKARGTTLGSDNGIGVAAALAVMASKDLQHGPVEALFTIDEETGMTGVFGLQPGWLKGDILMNLDSEDEGELYIGCAGGINTNASFSFEYVNVPANHVACNVRVTGFKGGHSGIDIILQRGNAIKSLTRILYDGVKNFELKLASIEGGSLRNAIPREAFATVLVPKQHAEAFTNHVSALAQTIISELKATENDIKIELNEVSVPAKMIDQKTAVALINSLYACPHGVMRMSDYMPIPETSTNLAIVKIDGNTIKVTGLQRSFVDSAREDLCNMIRSVFELAGAEVVQDGGYPGWRPNVDSPVLQTMKDVYTNHFGKVPEIKSIHAGLECGLLGGIYPNLDMISFGPTIRFPHSPDEKVNIATVAKFWEFLTISLKNIPVKN